MRTRYLLAALLSVTPTVHGATVYVQKTRDLPGGDYMAILTRFDVARSEFLHNTNQYYNLAHFSVPMGGGKSGCISSTVTTWGDKLCTQNPGSMCYGTSIDPVAYAQSLVGIEMQVHTSGMGGGATAIISCGTSYVHGITVQQKPQAVLCKWSGNTDFTHRAATVGSLVVDVSHPWTITCSGTSATTVTVTTARDITLKNGSGELGTSSMSVGRAGVYRETLRVQGTTVVDIISSVRDNIPNPGSYTGSSVVIAEWD